MACRPAPILLRSAVAAGLLVLAACTAQDALEPSALAPRNSASGALTGDGSGTSMATTTLPPSATANLQDDGTAAAPKSAALPAGANVSISLTPVVGMSAEAAAPLTSRLMQDAQARGIGLAGQAGGTAATHTLKGYLSALSEGPETTVIYVWDVYDAAGNRVHRISGQQKARSAGGSGWAAVPPQTLQAIADATVAELAAWLTARSAG